MLIKAISLSIPEKHPGRQRYRGWVSQAYMTTDYPYHERQSMKNTISRWTLVITGVFLCTFQLQSNEEIPTIIQKVLRHTQPLARPRLDRLPLYLWSINNALVGVSETQTRIALQDLDQRGIGYCVNWNHASFESSVEEGLRIAKLQKTLGLKISVNANACLHHLYDGTEATAHIDKNGEAFWDTSFGPETGCPFALEHRIPVVADRITRFVDAYHAANLKIDFIFADWEIDGPMEWNDAWEHSQQCTRCQKNFPPGSDFRVFQSVLRRLRSTFQKNMFSAPVLKRFPDALVGNYGVNPHGGSRYWYDYYEKLPEVAPTLKDHAAHYREWAPEFKRSGYTMSMPVVYTWHSIFESYPFGISDYRWFYNMLKVASNAGANTPAETPSVPFVHWHTTAPPADLSEPVEQFSEKAYQDLLWHTLLRGHDSFFLWCLHEELEKEVALVHEVYAQSIEYNDYIQHGIPIDQYVPGAPSPVISGLRLGNKVLIKRNDFNLPSGNLSINLSETESVEIPTDFDLGVLPVSTKNKEPSWIESSFPIGFYEFPEDNSVLTDMAKAGINLIRCSSKNDLDRAEALGMKGWMPLGVQEGLTDNLMQRASEHWNHPALAVWEGPDEIIWTFTAYSFLEERAGFTREDWDKQRPKAVQYAASVGPNLLYRMRKSIDWLKRNDPQKRPFWINEAADSDAFYARGYVDSIDIIGCDYYAVRATGSDMTSIGRLTKRWDAIGKGRPVWMVLQGFSWHALRDDRERRYPSFSESRFMAYDAIVHGAQGLLYWGTETIDDPMFRQSLYAITSELAAIEHYVKKTNLSPVPTRIIPDLFEPESMGVKAMLGIHETDSLLILVNKDAHRHLGVEIQGLEALNGQRLHLLYGQEMQIPDKGSFITRMQANGVKIFATDPSLAKGTREGRSFVDRKE